MSDFSDICRTGLVVCSELGRLSVEIADDEADLECRFRG